MSDIKKKKKWINQAYKEMSKKPMWVGELKMLRMDNPMSDNQEEVLAEIEETPNVTIRTTYYSNIKTGEFLGMKNEYQDKDGKWITL